MPVTRRTVYKRDVVIVTFKVSRDLLEALDRYAKAKRMYRSDVIRLAIRQYLAREGFLPATA